MQLHYTKEELYKKVDDLKKQIGISRSDYPIDTIDRCQHNSQYTVKIKPLYTNGLQGILLIDAGTKHIFLNGFRTKEEQNFFCMHEVIHGYFHKGVGNGSFNCYEKVRPNQNKFIEWHANEGAAEFLVPHKDFIPKVLSCWSPSYPWPIPQTVIETLADDFAVSERVIFNRIENLKYEIIQVHRGTKIDDVVLMSAAKQKNLGISVRSLNESVFTERAEQFYKRTENF